MFRLIILALLLNQAIIPMKSEQVNIGGVPGVRPVVSPGYINWWQESARPGQGSNIVLYGHNTDVFRDLHRIQPNAAITLTWQGRDWGYRVSRVLLVDRKNPVENGRLISPTPIEQVTLVTCYGEGHLIIIAD